MTVVVDGVEFQEPVEGKTAVPISITPLSKHVHCMHNWWQDWGPGYLRTQANVWSRNNRTWNTAAYGKQKPPIAFTEEWARGRIQKGLDKIKKGLVLAAFPSMLPYNKNAALLREFGFRLLGGKCYPNANYAIQQYRTMAKGNIYSPDGYPHWIHVWVRDLGGVQECGECKYGRTPTAPLPGARQPATPPPSVEQTVFPNCCGIRLRWSTEKLKHDPYGTVADLNRYLTIAQIPADQLFPKDSWQRFALYKDFKWGVNWKSSSVRKVQDCPHEFDLKKIEEWELAQPLPK